MAQIPIYRRDFKSLADLRIEDARLLLRSGRQQGAYYLCGYAVECALKACIAKTMKLYQFPPSKEYIYKIYSHNLNSLVNAAGLDGHLQADINANFAFAANWNTVKDWNEESRYKGSGLSGTDLYNAVTGADGVLPWIKRRW
jgi:hypothetical protein